MVALMGFSTLPPSKLSIFSGFGGTVTICRHPTAGSFVRREKLNFGKSLVEVITEKYGKKESERERKLRQQEIDSLQKSIKAPFIEFVGFDKVQTRQRLGFTVWSWRL